VLRGIEHQAEEQVSSYQYVKFQVPCDIYHISSSLQNLIANDSNTTTNTLNMLLSSEVIQNLQKTVDSACADPKSDIPGTTIVVVGKDGKELFAHAAGKRGVNISEDMTLENVFWIASCTKMIAGIAVMQLVEQGKLHLDDGDELEKLIPELKDTKVLQKDGKLVEKKTKITLRMLLAHTGMFACGGGVKAMSSLE
jgi:CubicO group peptidase (beta-lactamase class C family)